MKRKIEGHIQDITKKKHNGTIWKIVLWINDERVLCYGDLARTLQYARQGDYLSLFVNESKVHNEICWEHWGGE